MKKRIFSTILALFLAVNLIPAGLVTKVSAAETEATYYFRNQLRTQASKIFYQAMEQMLADGTFKTGDGAIEISAMPGYETAVQELCSGHANGRVNLITEYGAARDAFYADHPDVFYVDFSALTVRITQSQDKLYHLYLGAGRYPTYYTEGITSKEQVDSAVKDYNKAFDAMIDATKSASSDRDKVIAVHDYLTNHVTYRDELSVSDPNNMGFIRTAYGALVVQEGVCESYTRAFKAAMDYYGIPCVMVSGVYIHDENTKEYHIWNNVMLDGVWYGVDVTMDDPKSKTSTGTKGVDGFENHEYLLVDTATMDVHHYPDGQMSPGGFNFNYPTVGNEFIEISDSESPLKVRFRSEVYDSEIQESGTYYVSYLGMNAVKMINNGYYLIMRNRRYDAASDDPNELGWHDTPWYYYTPELFYDDDPNSAETRFTFPHVEYVEFGVTTVPYPKIKYDQFPDIWYHGDESLLLARSGLLHNESGTYRAAPASLHGDPSYSQGAIEPGTTAHLTAYFNDILVTPEVYDAWCKTERAGEDGYYEAIRTATVKDISLSASVEDRFMGTYKTDAMYQDIRNLEISFTDTETVIEFDYTTSNLWIDDNCIYHFFLSGLVGAYSGKVPGSFGWVCRAPCAICAYRSRGFDYNTYAKPVLVADQDLSMDGWVDSEGNEWDGSKYDGTTWEENLRNRLMLVVEDSGRRDSHNMEEKIDGLGEEVLSALTYNINLTLCSRQWAELKDGMSVRIQLGFPVGFGPEDEGVTFKAYHFTKDSATGEITGIEEIPCIITQYGLLIEVKSFSPFAICAVEKKPGEKVTKTVVLGSDVGGKITADKDGSVITLDEGESVKITVTPNSDYIIDTVEASSTDACNYSNEADSYSFTLSYEDIDESASSTVISATFVVKEIAADEEGDAIIPYAVAPEAAEVVSTSLTADPNGNVTLRVKDANENYTYNWYKIGENGDVFVGSGAELALSGIDSMGHAVDNSGSYYCIAVATAGATTASSEKSKTVTVTSKISKPREFEIASSPIAENGVLTVDEGSEIAIGVKDPETGCEYLWFRDGEQIKSDASDTSVLVLAPVTTDMAGVYTCVEKNAKGEELKSSNSITLKVNIAAPAEFYIIGDAEVASGKDVTLSVERPVEGLEYTWYKTADAEGKAIDKAKVGTGYEITLKGGDIAGTYICVALDPKTKLETSSSNSVKVTVIKTPEHDDGFEVKVNGEAKEVVTAKAGEEITISVEPIDGYSYTWYIVGSDRAFGTGESLKIKVSEQTVGVYYCEAELNGVKKISARISVELEKTAYPTDPQPPAHTQHVPGAWQYNSDMHYSGCITCGMILNSGAHSFNEAGRCVVCGYINQNLPTEDEEDPDTFVVVETPTEAPTTEDDPDGGAAEPPAETPVAPEENPKTGLFLSPLAAAIAAAGIVLKKR